MATYFITACAHMHQNLFQRAEVAELMVETFLKYRDAGEFELHEYVVMPDHIHVLVSIPHDQVLSRVVQLIKGGFSHTLREHGIVMRAVWEQRYHDRRIRDGNEYAAVSEYIRQNPVRKGFVENAADYPYSSVSVLELKPIEPNENSVDATLKGCSTSHCAQDATLKGRSTGRANDVDANLKVRSTSESDKKCIATS